MNRKPYNRFSCYLAYLNIDGWHGVIPQQILVVGQTPKKFRIQAIIVTKLAGRGRYLDPGQRTLVPKHAVTVKKSELK